MNISENYITTADNKKIYTKSYIPTDAKAVVIILHALGEHSGRFGEFCSYMYENKVGTFCYDHRGHGNSDGVRGFAKSFNKYIEDVETIVSHVENEYKGLPVVLYGHSFGANVLINYCIKSPCIAKALIVSSPWFRLTNQPGDFKLLLAKVFKFIPVAATRTGLDPKFLSRNKEVVNHYITDPLVHDKLSGKLFHEIVKFGKIASRSVYKINKPLLVMHGTNDNITSSGASEEFVQNSSSMTELKLWEDYYHELHNDEGKEKVMEYVLNWLNRTIV